METGKSLYPRIIHLKRTFRDCLVQRQFNPCVPGAAEPVFLDWNSGMPFTKPYFLSNLKSQEILATTNFFFSIVQESIDESFIKEAILTRLDDDNIDVVSSAISAFEVSDFVVH